MILQVFFQNIVVLRTLPPNNDPALVDHFLKQFATHLTQIGQRLLLERHMGPIKLTVLRITYTTAMNALIPVTLCDT